MPEKTPPVAKIHKDAADLPNPDPFLFEEEPTQNLPANRVIAVDTDESHSSHEVARAVLMTFLKPFRELEKNKLLQNMRVVLFGSAVSTPKRPNDLDVLIIGTLDEEAYLHKMNSLTQSADARMMEMQFSGGGIFAFQGMPHGWFPHGLHYQFLTEAEVIEEHEKSANSDDTSNWFKAAVADGAQLLVGENIIDSYGEEIFKVVDKGYLKSSE